MEPRNTILPNYAMSSKHLTQTLKKKKTVWKEINHMKLSISFKSVKTTFYLQTIAILKTTNKDIQALWCALLHV